MGLSSNAGRQNGAHCSISVVGLKFYRVEGLGSSPWCLGDLLQGMAQYVWMVRRISEELEGTG